MSPKLPLPMNVVEMSKDATQMIMGFECLFTKITDYTQERALRPKLNTEDEKTET